MDLRFPDDFIWGASTAAYQIEGAAFEDGRGLSIWDTFSHTPGKVADGDTGDVACDHYHRYREDVRLVAELGLGAYRFSTAWPRLFPNGRGRVNPKGRDFYDRLVDALLAAGVAPWLCCYHWDLPQALQERGGWAARDTAYYFADYAEQLAGFYGDRVGHFILLNEPNVAALLGHLLGVHAPGEADLGRFGAALHHFNLATGLGLERLRSAGSWQLGTVLNLQPVHPATDEEPDLHAAALFDAFWNRSALEPLLRGSYPDATRHVFEPFLEPGDLEQIRQPLDFLGLNHYTRFRVRAEPGSFVGIAQAEPPRGAARTAMGWEIHPDALHETLLELKEDYGNPRVYVTENGAAFDDVLGPDGRVDDARRVAYLAGQLGALERALAAGARVEGYFVWSLLDNFEWAEGYSKRFGLVYVDYPSQRRIPKRSYAWFQDLIRAGGLEL